MLLAQGEAVIGCGEQDGAQSQVLSSLLALVEQQLSDASSSERWFDVHVRDAAVGCWSSRTGGARSSRSIVTAAIASPPLPVASHDYALSARC